MSNQLKRRLMIFLAIVGGLFALRFLFPDVLTLANFQQHAYQFHNFVQNNYGISVAIFIIVCALATALFIPVTIVATIASGFLFGAIPGAAYAIIGVTIGSMILFFVIRWWLKKSIEQQYAQQLAKLNKELKAHGHYYLLSLQLFPLTPTFLINTLAGVTPISAWQFCWTTVVGILPGSLVYSIAGQQLMTIEKPGDIFSWPIILGLVLLTLLAVLPLLKKKLF